MKFGSSALRFFPASFVALLLLAPAAAVSSARQAGAGVKADSTQVVVPLCAVDKDGVPVEGLKPEDLRVTVEGEERKVVALSRGADGPLHVVLLRHRVVTNFAEV